MNNKEILAPKLPHDTQLTSAAELVGHTIAAMIIKPAGPCADAGTTVIVTATNC